MPIGICEFCGKPYNTYIGKLCAECSKIVDESYLKARKFIYQNPKSCDFRTIVEETDVTDKALSYLINKGRIEIANRSGAGLRCRACGKETSSGALCDACKAKLVTEKLTDKAEELKKANAERELARKKILPTSFDND